MSFITGLFRSTANTFRDMALPPAERRMRENVKRICEMTKIASITSVIVSLFFLAIFPSIFTLLMVGGLAFGASEVHKVADNLLEIFRQATVEFSACRSREAAINQLSKNTFLVGPLLRIFIPIQS